MQTAGARGQVVAARTVASQVRRACYQLIATVWGRKDGVNRALPCCTLKVVADLYGDHTVTPAIMCGEPDVFPRYVAAVAGTHRSEEGREENNDGSVDGRGEGVRARE